MKKLQLLGLSKNALSSITPAMFGIRTKFESLTWLDLSKNKGLTSFSREFFQLFPNLEVLELSGLHLDYLPYLGTLNKLDVLLIDGSLISTIYPCDLVGLSSLTELYWDGAPIDCGCQSLWMKTWTDNYMKFRLKDARLNPKGTLPDWEWKCKKPLILINKDFRHLLAEEVSGQCKHKSVSVGNLTLKVHSKEGSLSVVWDMPNSVGSDLFMVSNSLSRNEINLLLRMSIECWQMIPASP